MSKKLRLIYATSFCVICVTLILLYFFPTARDENPLPIEINIPAYENLILNQAETVHPIFAYQAKEMIEAGVDISYRTDFIETIVIVVDRDLVPDKITGWTSLRNGAYRLQLYNDTVDIGYLNQAETLNTISTAKIILAIAAGLDDPKSANREALSLLRYLYDHNRLSVGTENAPVLVMADFQAAKLIQAGKNLEIIVPEEGTLSFPVGILSHGKAVLPVADPQALISAGFRLPDGRCDQNVYPDKIAYAAVKASVEDANFGIKHTRTAGEYYRSVTGESSTLSSEGRRILYIGFIVILTLWSAALLIRISDKVLLKKLLIILLLIAFWMLLRLMKQQLTLPILVRFSWYLYYLFILYIPMVMLWIGCDIGGVADVKVCRTLKWVSLAVSTTLFLLVATNDLHQMAFVFPEGIKNYEVYDYGWVYFAVCPVSLIQLLGFIVGSSLHGRKQHNANYAALIALIGVALFYFISYLLRIPVFFASELAITYAVISLAFLEISFRGGLVPNNTKYGNLFRFSNIDLQILDNEMQVVYTTESAMPLSADISKRISLINLAEETQDRITLPYDEGAIYDVYRIGGGYSVISKRIDTVLRLREKLGRHHAELVQQNEILLRSQDVKSEQVRILARRSALSQIDATLREEIRTINITLDSLSDGNGDYDESIQRAKFIKIKLLVNHCKRRATLTLAEMSRRVFDTASLALWIREALYEAEEATIKGRVTETGNALIPTAKVAVLYDCFSHILVKSVACDRPVIIVCVDAENENVKLRVMLEAETPLKRADFQIAEYIISALASFGADFILEQENERLFFSVTMPAHEQPASGGAGIA